MCPLRTVDKIFTTDHTSSRELAQALQYNKAIYNKSNIRFAVKQWV